MFCPKCGYENNNYSRFCSKCGVTLPANESLMTQMEMQQRAEAEKKYRVEQMNMLKKAPKRQELGDRFADYGNFLHFDLLIPEYFRTFGHYLRHCRRRKNAEIRL